MYFGLSLLWRKQRSRSQWHESSQPEEKKPLLQKINWFRKKDSEENPKPAERDPFSVALERSFGGEDIEAPRLQMSIGEEENQPASADEPHFEIEPPAASEEPPPSPAPVGKRFSKVN